MDETGFVISAEHGLVVPKQTVTAWSERFPHIADLEAEMTGLATAMLSKGVMHPGWLCPEGWMVKPLAQINQEAADKKRITEARVARASSSFVGVPQARGKSRRAELDQA